MAINIKQLGECVETIIDCRGKTPLKLGGTWTNNGVRVISALNVHNGYIDNENDIRCVDESIYKKWMPEDICRNDCFIASEGASLGENTIWDSDEKIVLGQRLYAIRTNKDILDPWYFACYMQTENFRNQIHNISTGSTVFGISQPILKSVKIYLPDISIQNKIGNIYKDIHRKIINNNATISELEAMAKTLYDYWFLQFDFPDENGKPYKSSGGKMVWNEELKREIPEGWEVTTIGNITNCYDSKRVPLSSKEREQIAGNIPYYGATGIMGYVNKSIFDGEYVLMAEDGSIMDENFHPILQRASGKVWVNNHTHVLEPIQEYSCKLLMLILKDVYVPTIKTGSIQAKITQDNMNNIKIVDIPIMLRRKISNIFEPIDLDILKLLKENQELASFRDFLLPTLMNGQVTFKEMIA